MRARRWLIGIDCAYPAGGADHDAGIPAPSTARMFFDCCLAVVKSITTSTAGEAWGAVQSASAPLFSLCPMARTPWPALAGDFPFRTADPVFLFSHSEYEGNNSMSNSS